MQIKKYLEGKLDARAMYELERRALDDPFLMDAMEGYEAAGNQGHTPAELAVTLQNRLQKSKARVISFGTMAMAASVITVLTVGGWWIFYRPVTNQPEIIVQAGADKTTVAPSPLVKEPQIAINKDSLLALNMPKAVIRSPRRMHYNKLPGNGYDIPVTSDETAELASSISRDVNLAEESVTSVNARLKKDSVPLDEMLVMGYAKQRKKETTQNVDKAMADRSAVSIAASAPVVAGVLKGKVVSAEDGQPIPGVTVRAGNSANAVFTDKDGLYALKLDSINTDITYNYLGYRTRKLDVRNNNPANIALEPESISLNEVVIVNGAATRADAQPKYGWENFQKYLNANSVSPNGKTGSYRVSFTVASDGSLSNFEINKAENDIAAQKAIQLIKNGPEWVGGSRGQAKKITVTVKFRKPEK